MDVWGSCLSLEMGKSSLEGSHSRGKFMRWLFISAACMEGSRDMRELFMRRLYLKERSEVVCFVLDN